MCLKLLLRTPELMSKGKSKMSPGCNLFSDTSLKTSLCRGMLLNSRNSSASYSLCQLHWGGKVRRRQNQPHCPPTPSEPPTLPAEVSPSSYLQRCSTSARREGQKRGVSAVLVPSCPCAEGRVPPCHHTLPVMAPARHEGLAWARVAWPSQLL